MIWHVLDINSIWVKEFTSALARFVPAIGWSPQFSWTALLSSQTRREEIPDPPLTARHFPLQRGYSRFPISALVNLGSSQMRRMRQEDADTERSPLICTTPFYAPVAERWDGPVIYYQTDLTFGYAGLKPAQVLALDKRLCHVANLVCPNSQRVGEYMVERAGCDPKKIVVVPNATRLANIAPEAPNGPGPLPSDLADLPRPIIGVIGNLAANLDWVLLDEAVKKTPQFSWAFIGPTSMEVPEPLQNEARQSLIALKSRIRFTRGKPYQQLQEYARAVDVAVLPYRRKEPTYSGSSTRFYEHLAACRPMLSTRGFEELLHKQPLLRLFDTADELVVLLNQLAGVEFKDGYEQARWKASRSGTWEVRAATVIEALRSRCPADFTEIKLPSALLPDGIPNTTFEKRAEPFTLAAHN